MFKKIIFSAACLLVFAQSVKLGCDGNCGCGCGCQKENHCEGNPIVEYQNDVTEAEIAKRTAEQMVEDYISENDIELTDDERQQLLDQFMQQVFDEVDEKVEEDPSMLDTIVHDVAEMEMAESIVDSI